LLAEISLPKLAIAWILLIGLPGITLGVAPLIVSLWLSTASSKVSLILASTNRARRQLSPGAAGPAISDLIAKKQRAQQLSAGHD
jgi:hypothetical protein